MANRTTNMEKAYSRINWENEPSTSTPINETNLNAMDEALDTIDDRVVDLNTEVASFGSYVTRAESAAKTSESYAKGGTGTRAGEDTDNAKYYCQQASTFTPTGYADLVAAVGGLKFSAKSQTEYDALATKDANTIYFVYEV